MRVSTVCTVLGFLMLACGGEEGGQGGLGGGDSGAQQNSFQWLYGSYLHKCAYCHSPTGPGRSSDIEQTLDFSTVDTAYNTITQGSAQGLQGNQEACNGVPFIGPSYEKSLLAAVLDEDVRSNFSAPYNPGCDADAVSDMTLKVGQQPGAQFLGVLKAWIEAGAPR